jgi:disulfide oxidoreductase YuzD
MYTRKEIENMVSKCVKTPGIKHISDMLEEIQNRMYSIIKDELYYTPDKFTQNRVGQRNSKFVELCADEKWDEALLIADTMNKEVLTTNTADGGKLFHDFVEKIKNSSDYISIVRSMKLSKLVS